MIGLLFTLLWFPLIGLATSRLAGRMNVFLAGAGVNGLVLFIAGALHVPLIPVLVVMGLAAVGIVLRVIPSEVEGSPPARDPSTALGMTLLSIGIASLLFVSAIAPLTDYDGRAFWLLKAKAIAHERSIDGPFFHGRNVSPRNEYPLLVPLDAATVMIAARELDDRHVRWLYVMFAIALALEVRRRIGPWYGALVVWLPQIAVHPDGSALSAYSDIALAAFVACAIFGVRWQSHRFESGGSAAAVRYGLWLAFAALTKNEGLPFALILLVIGVFVFRARAALAAVPLGVAMASLFLWRSHIDPSDEAIFTITELPNRLGRLDDVLLLLGRHVFAFRDWGALWIAVAAAIVVLAWRKNWRPLSIGLGAIVPMLALCVIMYMVSNWTPADLVNSTAPRLLTHFIGPALLLIQSACESLEPSKKPATP